ncbi:hypothetical protein PHYSODRAFT_353995 [Phytophthora sojae]|uniref:Ubiquitin-like domain-containing protein n=1 Tax=Phytophthora sojae (strain P6497) TaxID=1094619 RepID=G4Z190_PHYSP|nr:hypothetical protein PHYSODRAFT_353995 [Phytophthora sojae]EGZ24709.1 hypothetical protein PHYSODRAFT_353995 [Phytophthora sojae]|eukprot:XP_009519997.1 hypothetical protein PHYSODRAFT_353995 [Phytophthora sojae]
MYACLSVAWFCHVQGSFLSIRLQFVPGPGTYEVPEQWPVRDVTATPTAAFLSRTMRGSFSPSRRAASAYPSSPTRQAVIDHYTSASGDKASRPHTAYPELPSPVKTSKSPRSRLRLPGSSSRRDLVIQIPEQQQDIDLQPAENDTSASTSYSSLNPQNVSAFSKVGREPVIDKEVAPAVGTYDIKRLWDSSTPRTTLGAPSPALFGASKEKRVVIWRPALTPASYNVSTSWDSSRHYAKQKDKVVRSAAKRRLHSAKLHARSMSSPTIRPSTADANLHNEPATADSASTETPENDDDPFSWLRQRPNGEHRVNFLAAKHGLVHHIRSPTRRATDNRHSTVSHSDEPTTPGSPSSRLLRQHSNLQDEDTSATETLYTAKPKDVRIKVSCRMPGGMLISASVYSMKKLGHFKSAILVRQKRFQTVEQFDLYHASGRKLTGLEETLASCGVRDRSMLQIVPAVTVALTPQGNQITSEPK